jgi:hypothetical protein
MQKFTLVCTVVILSIFGSSVWAQEAETEVEEVHRYEPVEINNSVVYILDSLKQYQHLWKLRLGDINKADRNFSNLKDDRLVWENYVNRKLAMVKGMNDSGGSARLRGAIYTVLIHNKKMLNTVAIPYEKLTSKSPIEFLKKHLDAMHNFEKQELTYLDMVQAEQQIFAKKNKIILYEIIK